MHGNTQKFLFSIMYQFPSFIKDKVRDSILITGSARSGTTIFGKLVGSLNTVEYFFEPPTLFSLFSLLNKLPSQESCLLFETFVYEELLVGALSGRMINLRNQDDSSIKHTKTDAEIARRMNAIGRKGDIETEKATIALKLPDFVYRLPEINKTLGLQKLLISVREPSSTISSLLRKGWFKDESLQAGIHTWPNLFEGRVPKPHWVPKDWLEIWDEMTEVDRAALYFVTQTKLPMDLPESALIFSYDQLIKEPVKLLGAVADHLGLSFGSLTKNILTEVTEQKTTEYFNLKLLSRNLRNRVEEVYANAIKQCFI